MTSTTRLLRALPLSAAVALGAYGLLSGRGILGVVLFVAILFFAAALAVWARGADEAAREVMRRTATAALLCAPAFLVVFFSFDSGGFFPDSVALGDIVVALMLLVRLALAEQPLAAFGRAALVPFAGFAGLAVWALASQLWSHAPGRATIAFDRDLLYALTFALFASVGGARERIVWALRGVALAMAAIAAIALLSSVAPDVLVTAADPAAAGRLAYPLTYWNALGIFCAVAGVLCLHLSADDDRPLVRVLAAGALPVIGAALLLTYSRGGLAAAAFGLALYAVLGRPRALLPALIATVPTCAVAIAAAYDATLLSAGGPITAAVVHQGHKLGLVVGACVVAAVALRVALLRLDRLLEGENSPIERYRRGLRASFAGAAVVAIVAALALGAPAAVVHRVNQFADQQELSSGPLVRSRLSSTSNNGRVALWKISWNALRAHPLDGTGAETFEILYFEHRKNLSVVVNAHSLYIETLGDLGLIGLAFVVAFVLGTLAGLAPLRRGRDRALYAALFSAALAWSIHAGVDWDWQMPAASLWFAALGGLALGRPASRATARAASVHLRAFVVGAVVVGVSIFPALVLASQIRLNQASNAYAAGNCALADKRARSSIDVLGTRAPPWQIEALCAVVDGHFKLAQTDLRHGLAEDPSDWQLEAALAAARAAAGFDARSQAAAALALNPEDPAVRALADALAAGPSKAAREIAQSYLSQQSLIVSG